MGGVLLLACTLRAGAGLLWGASIRFPFWVQVQGGQAISNLTFGPLFLRLAQALVAVLLHLGGSWESPIFLTFSPAIWGKTSAHSSGLG